jgi:hypothetical protein
MKAFDIKPYDNFDVKFRLVICKTRKEMIRARKKYTPEDIELKDNEVKETTAVFCPMPYHINDNKIELPGSFKSNVFGTMFINLDDLRKYGDKVIAHECGHAAFSFHKHIRRYMGNFGDDNDGEFQANGEGDEQEVFCYFLENAFEKVKQAIREYTRK